MKKIILIALLSIFGIQTKAQYATIDAILTRLEERKGINKNANNISINDKKFIQITDFDDHTERKFIICKGDKATYVEIFDDKETGKSTSNVFTGDVKRNKHNIVSIRANLLEGKPIAIPITKTLLLTKLEGIIYLIDVNNKERWIDQVSFGKERKNKKKKK